MSFAPFVAALLLVPSLSFLGIPAHAQEIEVGSSLICDTEEQAERFIALYNGDKRATITAVNAEMHDPTACGLATTAYVRGPQLATARNKDITFSSFRYLWSVSPMKMGAWNRSPPQSSSRYFLLTRSRSSGQNWPPRAKLRIPRRRGGPLEFQADLIP